MTVIWEERVGTSRRGRWLDVQTGGEREGELEETGIRHFRFYDVTDAIASQNTFGYNF